jgi:hypothetical protein
MLTRNKEDRTEYAEADVPDNFSFFQQNVAVGPALDARGANRNTLRSTKTLRDEDFVGKAICFAKSGSGFEDDEGTNASRKLDSTLPRLEGDIQDAGSVGGRVVTRTITNGRTDGRSDDGRRAAHDLGTQLRLPGRKNASARTWCVRADAPPSPLPPSPLLSVRTLGCVHADATNKINKFFYFFYFFFLVVVADLEREKKFTIYNFRFSIPKIPKLPKLPELYGLRGRSREKKKVFSA